MDSEQMILLIPMTSFGPLDMASIEMPRFTGQLIVISQAPTKVTTNITVHVTNILANVTNQSVSGCPIYHEWV